MGRIHDFFTGIFGAAAGVVIFACYGLIAVGSLYWFWMAIQLGSFLMFLVLLFPPAFIVAAPVGAYSMIFGVPSWVISTFG